MEDNNDTKLQKSIRYVISYYSEHNNLAFLHLVLTMFTGFIWLVLLFCWWVTRLISMDEEELNKYE